MDAKLLQRIMRLIEQTGDRMIVVNPESGKAHAVLPFAAYEKMATGFASLRDLSDGFDPYNLGEDDDECPLCEETGINLDELDDDDILKNEQLHKIDEEVAAAVAREMEEEKKKAPEQGLDIEIINQKLSEESQKLEKDATPLDVLLEGEKDDEYYLEPIE